MNARASDARAVSTRAADGFQPPENKLEEVIAMIWREVLELERVGRHDLFTDLGGNSLLAVQMMVRLRGLTGVSVPLRLFFEIPTVAALSALVQEEHARAKRGAQAPSATPAPPAPSSPTTRTAR